MIAPIDDDERLVTRVGLWSLAVLVLVIAFFVFVFGRIDWHTRIRVRVYFHQVAALHEGAPFVVAGRTIGTVESIALAPRAASLHGDDGVAVTVAIDAHQAARLDPTGDVFVASKGMFADRYLELGPAREPSPTIGLHDGAELVGRDPPSLDRVLQRTWDNLQDLQAFADDIRPELDALRAAVSSLQLHLDPASASAIPNVAEVAPLFIELAGVRDEVATLRATGLGGDAGLARLALVLDRAGRVDVDTRAALGKLDTGLTALRAKLDAVRATLDAHGQGIVASFDLAIDRVRADLAKLDPLLATVAAIQQSLARGEGSLMKLANDPEFPEDAKELGKVLKRHPWRILEHPIH
ncbi:MAG TPA: MlaD family protein [Kofleriaceae bacterium]